MTDHHAGEQQQQQQHWWELQPPHLQLQDCGHATYCVRRSPAIPMMRRYSSSAGGVALPSGGDLEEGGAPPAVDAAAATEEEDVHMHEPAAAPEVAPRHGDADVLVDGIDQAGIEVVEVGDEEQQQEEEEEQHPAAAHLDVAAPEEGDHHNEARLGIVWDVKFLMAAPRAQGSGEGPGIDTKLAALVQRCVWGGAGGFPTSERLCSNATPRQPLLVTSAFLLINAAPALAGPWNLIPSCCC